jgi:hypothetical protein
MKLPAYVKIVGAWKLDIRAKEGKFVGYDDESKGVAYIGQKSEL